MNTNMTGARCPAKQAEQNVGVEHYRGDQNAKRAAYTTAETRQLLGGISARSLRRLEQRGLLLPSRGLRTKLYSLKAIERYLEATV
jgi:hypothetical protein